MTPANAPLDIAPLDIAHLQSWIGRTDTATEVATADLVRRFHATFDVEPGAPQPGEAAPPLLHWCLTQPAAPTGQLGPDGHPMRGGFLPPVPLPRRMWAGGDLRFDGAIAVGDTVQRLSRVDDVTVKTGRTGTLCFVTVAHEITSGSRLVVRERQDIVYRGLDPAPGTATTPETASAPKPAPVAAPAGAHQRVVDPSPPLLFRYSALTFNGHRIHYDRSYVTQVEGYPGLIVHGPLQATLLLRFASEIHGAAPARFSFRALSPLFDTAPVQLHADADGTSLKLWTARPGGPLAMTAEAQW
ncbi:FAS1-like dehydratase domain-containing protein [Xanthobacter sp. ZOL 2024]